MGAILVVEAWPDHQLVAGRFGADIQDALGAGWTVAPHGVHLRGRWGLLKAGCVGQHLQQGSCG